ncbi:hypothetical protein QQ008_02160 [Fulvivirgaceae bacterium BMA10]|uniref:DUF748 domain-containing protein n=1 Tax=Splendidivirga corallicola TaxID=3051826 RepID=A0ABT8KHE4_9BACT|nr:hypothetical protein [Fulvivirgaceae bacterium BMA10]
MEARKAHKKKQIRPGRAKRRILRTVISLISFLVILQLILFYFSGPIVKTYLQEVVQSESRGTYILDFEQVNVNIATRGFKIKALRLTPNWKIIERLNEGTRPYYEIYFPELTISGIAILDLYSKKILNIRRATVAEPDIDLIGQPNLLLSEKYDKVLDEIQPLVSKYIKALNIKRLELINGSFGLFNESKNPNQSATASNVSLILSAFKIDSTTSNNQRRLLFSDDIELQIENYKLKLSDSIHVLEAKQVKVSTAESRVHAKAIWLLPSYANDSLKQAGNVNFYDIYVPELDFTDADIYKAYFDHALSISKVTLSNPEIRFATSSKLASLEKSEIKNHLHALIAGYLDIVTVDTFNISNGNFTLLKHLDQAKPNLLAKNISVDLSSFRLDSNAFRSKDKIFYADNLDIKLHQYSMNLSDEVHRLVCENVAFSTRNSIALAEKVMLKPLSLKTELIKSRGENLYDIEVPQLTLKGVNFKKVYNFKELSFSTLLLAQPKVKINSYSDYYAKRVSKKQSKATIYNLIADYLKSIHVNNVQLNEGNLRFANHFRGNKKDTLSTERISFTLDNFKLDSTTAFSNSNRIFYADNIDFTLHQYVMRLSDDLHILKAEEVGISTKNSDIFAKEIQLFPLPVDDIKIRLQKSGKKSLFNIRVPNLKIRGADIRRAYFKNILNINQILIENPSIDLNNYSFMKKNKRNERINLELYSLFKNYLRSINIKKFNLNNGVFNLVTNTTSKANVLSQNHVSISADNFVLNKDSESNPNRIFYSDAIDVKLNDYVINLPDSIHILKAKEIGLSTAKSEIYLRSARLYPKSKRLDTVQLPAFYEVNAPRILMEGVDINKLYYDNFLKIKKITLDRTLFEVINQLSVKNKSDFITSSRSASMPARVKNIEIQNLVLNNGKMKLGNLVGNKKKIFSSTDIELKLIDFQLDSITLNNSKKILYAEDIDVTMDNYSLKLSDSIHAIYAKNVFISSGNKRISAEDFSFRPRNLNRNYQNQLKQLGKVSHFNISSPKIDLKGIDLEKAYLQKDYGIVNATINSPSFILTSYPENKPNKDKIIPQDVLNQLLSEHLKKLTVNQMDFKNGTFTHKQIFQSERKTFNLQRIAGHVKNFELNETSRQHDQRLFYSDDVDLVISNYTYKMPDSMYTFNARKIGVSTAKSRLFLDSVTFIPRFGKYQFSRKLGYEADRINASVRRIEFNKFNFKDYILRDQFESSLVNVYGLHVDDFRDKRLPISQNQKPKMPQEQLRDLDYNIVLDRVKLKDGYISYQEFVEEGQQPGTIYFENLNADLRNVTNDPAQLNKNDRFIMDAQADIMGKGRVKAKLSFSIRDKRNAFEFSGNIGAMNLVEINPMLENVAFVSVKSGLNQNLDFSMNANDNFAVGNMRFTYDDLRVSVIKKKTGNTGGLASFFANTFVINNKNPEGKNQRVGDIYFERDKSKSIFNYWWKSLLSGIKPSLGINDRNKKDKEEKAASNK